MGISEVAFDFLQKKVKKENELDVSELFFTFRLLGIDEDFESKFNIVEFLDLKEIKIICRNPNDEISIDYRKLISQIKLHYVLSRDKNKIRQIIELTTKKTKNV
jgi:hypothetical protein